MIISIEDRRGSRWPVAMILAVVCGLAYVGVGFLHQRALDGKVADQREKAVALTRLTIGPATRNADLTKPLPHPTAARLEHELTKGALAGDQVLRVRVFAQDGRLLFSTDPDDRVNAHAGDAAAIRAASIGSISSSVGTDRVSARGERPSSLDLVQTYTQLEAGKEKPGAAEIDQRYHTLEVAAQQPWQTMQTGLLAAAAVFLVMGLLLLGRRAAVKRAKTKAAAPPAPAKDEPAKAEPAPNAVGESERRRSFRRERSASAPPAATDAERARKDAQREMQVREALEGQLEQLRTRIREQEDLANRQVLELTQQLQVAAARIEDAEARAASTPSGADAERLAAAERQAQDNAQRVEREQARASAAEARVAELEGRLADAHRSVQPPPTDERIVELERALAEAREEAADNARRAEATEAVHDELETKVARFGSRAQEQEATATALAEQLREIEAVRADLERRASEAESGGDAVRSEVAQLTAERDSLRARVAELEASGRADEPEPFTQAAAGIEEIELLASAREELMDLRHQLAQAIERAGVAEERAAKLEADLLAERQGVRELTEAPAMEVADGDPAPTDPANPYPWMNGNGNGSGALPNDDASSDEGRPAEDAEESGDKSLRYRLAQSAARKKGLGELETPS